MKHRYPLSKSGAAALGLLFLAGSLAADTHIIVKSTMNFFGRDRVWKTDVWFCADKECRKEAWGTGIIRRDLGVRWMLRPSDKTYLEYPIKKEEAPPDKQPAAEGELKKEAEDLRFVGMDYEPDFEWTIKETGESKTIQGFPCRLYVLTGDADFAWIELKVWISPQGRSRGLDYVFEALNYYTRFFNPEKPLKKLLEKFPEGGIARIEVVSDPAISDQMTFLIEIEILEEKDPPENIYDLPEGYKKGEKK